MASLNAYVRSGQLKPFSGKTVIAPGVIAINAPGHTPGHVIYQVESAGKRLYVIGDLIHVGTVQFSQPSVTISFDSNESPTKQTDLYRQITDRIVVALENGVAPWRKPWRAAVGSGLAGLPLNATTGRHYSGVNALLLWMSAEEQGFHNNRWMTYRQA